MPVYEYACEAEHHYEKMEGFDAPPKQECPTCGKPSRRLVSTPAVIFKGPGFYSTDNPKGSKGASSPHSANEPGADAKDDTPTKGTPPKPKKKPAAGNDSSGPKAEAPA